MLSGVRIKWTCTTEEGIMFDELQSPVGRSGRKSPIEMSFELHIDAPVGCPDIRRNRESCTQEYSIRRRAVFINSMLVINCKYQTCGSGARRPSFGVVSNLSRRV